jgi:hypothetical protein
MLRTFSEVFLNFDLSCFLLYHLPSGFDTPTGEISSRAFELYIAIDRWRNGVDLCYVLDFRLDVDMQQCVMYCVFTYFGGSNKTKACSTVVATKAVCKTYALFDEWILESKSWVYDPNAKQHWLVINCICECEQVWNNLTLAYNHKKIKTLTRRPNEDMLQVCKNVWCIYMIHV